MAETLPPFWETMVRQAVDAAADSNDQVVVVGHSGAGVLHLAIGQCLGARLQALVFVDAQVPPASGSHCTPPALVKLLDEKTVDGTTQIARNPARCRALAGVLVRFSGQ